MYFKCPPFGSPSQPKDELWEDKNIAGKFQRQTRRPQSSCANPSCWFTECSLFTNFRRLVLTYSKGPAQEMRLNDLPATTYFEQAQYYVMLWLCRGNLWTRKVLEKNANMKKRKIRKEKERKKKEELPFEEAVWRLLSQEQGVRSGSKHYTHCDVTTLCSGKRQVPITVFSICWASNAKAVSQLQHLCPVFSTSSARIWMYKGQGFRNQLVGKKSAWEYLILDYIWYETSLYWAFGLLFRFQPPDVYPWVSKVTCIRLQGRRWTPSKVEDKHGVGEMPKWEIWHNDFQLWTLGMYCGYTCLVPSWHYFSVRWKQPADQHHFSWSSQLQQGWKKQSKSYTCSLIKNILRTVPHSNKRIYHTGWRIMTISTGLLLTYWLAVWITHIYPSAWPGASAFAKIPDTCWMRWTNGKLIHGPHGWFGLICFTSMWKKCEFNSTSLS